MRASLKINGLIVVSAGLLWALTHMLHDVYFPFLNHRPGIDLIFVPSGIRLLLLMIGGVWAAIGVCLGSLLLAGPEFGFDNFPDMVTIALISGFGTYAALRLTQWSFGITQHLGNLAPWHLPLISLCVAIGSSVVHNLAFVGLGVENWAKFADNTIAMAMGDFLGSLLVVAFAIGLLRLYRILRI
ncbi:hypothetical protein [Aestuariivirga sp.]|jgi:hypothetical protein|uniref:hypothetical protein n=1 Tax=Aestuariivirga sp. TaxID=2650926 RepID=UPI003782E26A